MGAIGVSIDENGRLNLDSARLQDAFTDDAKAVEEFFTTEEVKVHPSEEIKISATRSGG